MSANNDEHGHAIGVFLAGLSDLASRTWPLGPVPAMLKEESVEGFSTAADPVQVDNAPKGRQKQGYEAPPTGPQFLQRCSKA